jgi:enamine deaminase RidA (YjgF/YER057c/UK114 family)
MTRRFISSGSPYEKLAGYSRAVVDGKWVFVSGTIGMDFATGHMPDGAAAQAELAIDIIAEALAAAGASLEDVVRMRAIVPDRADINEVSAVIGRRLGPSRAANTTICSPLPVPDAKVEIEVTARKRRAARDRHVATAIVAASAEAAFAFMKDGLALGRWALGSFDTQALENGVFRGHSLFDGAARFIRIEDDAAKLSITYHVGQDPERLQPRILATIEPGAGTPPECRVSLIAWRDASMTDERWRHLTTTHETEILLVKALIERKP